jgi:hypothetical protein
MAYSDRHLYSDVSRDFDAISGTTVVTTFAPLNRVNVHKVGIRITSSQAGTGSVGFSRRRGASTDTLFATVTIIASADGKLLYEEVANPTEFVPGDILILVVAADSGTTPTGVPVIEYSINDEKLGDVGVQAVAE